MRYRSLLIFAITLELRKVHIRLGLIRSATKASHGNLFCLILSEVQDLHPLIMRSVIPTVKSIWNGNLSKHLLTLQKDTVQYDTSVWDDSIAGPLSVAWPNYVDPVATSFIDGLPSIGLSPNDLNFNSGYLNGTAWTTFTITGDSQHRDSSESSYLQDSLRMTDIVIYSESMAKQILFDQNKTATGVTVAQGPLEFTISASKEVILSAGVMQSPQILIVSGIGPSEVLSKYNIPIISGLKGVGQNLQVAIADV